MKIGILTLPLHTNYGGILQAYALQTVLERMGHEVKIICVKRKWIDRPCILKMYMMIKRGIKRYIFRKKIAINYDKYRKEFVRITCRFTSIFISKHINLFHIDEFSDIKSDEFDAFIVGSDQVWRKKYFTTLTNSSIDNAFLSFSKGWKVKRIAYAPSFGVDEWEYNKQDTKSCSEMLRSFNAVSVREIDGVKLCKKYLDIDAINVLDPTMLLQITDYINLIKQGNIPKNIGNLHQYILDITPEKRKLVGLIAAEKKLKPFSVKVDYEEDKNLPPEQLIQPPVEQWLRAFFDASFVVTDSFHACVFSILFKKQFIVIGNADRGLSRFHSLLSQFGLENRFITSVDQYRSLGDIDYDAIYKELEMKQMQSMDFLRKALNK